MKTCPKCRKELPEEATFCPYCMEKFAPENGAETTVASNAKNAVPSKSSKKIVWLAAGIGAAVVLIGALVLFLVMGNGKRAADESTSAPAGTADPPAGQAPGSAEPDGAGNAVLVDDSMISWANMKMDNPSLDLTPEQLAVVKYFDNDYFAVYDYDSLQRYPKAYRGAQISIAGMIEEILYADDDTFECIVAQGKITSDGPTGNYLIVRGKQPAQSRVAEGDVYEFCGRYIDIGSPESGAISGQYPIIAANYYFETTPVGTLPRFGLEDIIPVAKMMLGDDVKIREPVYGEDFDFDELHWPQYFFYLATPGNQSNDNFNSFEFSCMNGNVRDSRATVDVMRTFNVAADFEHYYLSIHDKNLNLFYLECYDRNYQKVWGREFHNVDTVPYDYTNSVIYLVADNDLYIIDAKTGEDMQEPVLVGQKVKVNLLPDGAILVGKGEKDNLMKVDLDGNIVWKVSADIDVTGCYMLQVVDGNVIADVQHVEANDTGGSDRFISQMVVVDESGNLVSEFTTMYYDANDSIAAAGIPLPSSSAAGAPASTASASDDGSYIMYVDADGGLNLRYGPSKDNESILKIPDGAQVRCFPDVPAGTGWIYVEYGGSKGYVAIEYLRYT